MPSFFLSQSSRTNSGIAPAPLAPAATWQVYRQQHQQQLASHLETVTPIEVTRHGRTVGLYVPLPQGSDQSERERLLEAGRLMQAELQRLGLTEEELADDFKNWRGDQQQQATT